MCPELLSVGGSDRGSSLFRVGSNGGQLDAIAQKGQPRASVCWCSMTMVSFGMSDMLAEGWCSLSAGISCLNSGAIK